MEVRQLLIRCDRCSTTYELDEALLSPEGSEVQCARCQHVFTVCPPMAPGRTLEGVPAQEAPQEAPPPAVAQPAAPAAPPSQPAGPSARRPAVYRPPPSHPAFSRAPVIRRDTVGTFESRLRWSHRWRWLAPALFVAAVGIAIGVFALREGLIDEGARHAHAHALQVALADDVQSLEQARAELDRALRSSPRLHAARADRALVDLLLAGALSELPGDKGDQSKVRHDRIRALVAAAGGELEELRKAALAHPEVARARAVAASLGADRAELRKAALTAEVEQPGEPWVAVAEASLDVRSTDRSARDHALTDLAVLVARRPDVLRARYVLARGQALAGRRNEALGTLDGLLKANPRHEGAAALRDAILRPPPGAPVAQPATAGTASGGNAAAAPIPDLPPRAEKTAAAPRKPDSTAGEGSAAPSVTGSSPASPQPRPDERASAATAAPAEPTAAGGGDSGPPVEPAPAPRLRPAAVPEPEPVRGGG